ncbi:hypothetical protein GCK72_012614 [Caenorhabditis remanei]|uniref:Uncharacterized protein n=1 Tax=Caenorhabditis remanei TaxID=31234 RepID=A0A6A5GNE9_CAERE|nr:hypothetical protein GCK72_012614 [Caenorhabditis remanei]KAF1756161.1 hypothetical protein GCK72_012614 [Caenorhabditis remanei]
MGKESESHKKLVKLAEQLVKSHHEISLERAIQIESQRQDAKKKRDEDGTVVVWDTMTIEDELEDYLKGSEEKDNWTVHEMDECVVAVRELEISDEKENMNVDLEKRQQKLRNFNSSNKKE